MDGYNYFNQRKALIIDDQEFEGNFHGEISLVDDEEQYDDLFDHAILDIDDESGENEPEEEDDDDDDRRVYWESQESLLQEILDHYYSVGSKLREQINRLVLGIARESNFCSCLEPKSYTCVRCLRREIVDQLCSKGFTTTICTSKWKRSNKMPGGMHEYIEVIASTQGRKKKIPFLVELRFQDEFRMGKACDEYNRLINQLPEVYIGKAEHLNAIIRIVCDAAKRSAMEQKIHMGPWRKINFMQMKWSASRQSADKSTEIPPRQGHANARRSSVQLPLGTALQVA